MDYVLVRLEKTRSNRRCLCNVLEFMLPSSSLNWYLDKGLASPDQKLRHSVVTQREDIPSVHGEHQVTVGDPFCSRRSSCNSNRPLLFTAIIM